MTCSDEEYCDNARFGAVCVCLVCECAKRKERHCAASVTHEPTIENFLVVLEGGAVASVHQQ